MKRNEAVEIVRLPEDQSVPIVLELAEKAEKYDKMMAGTEPGTPSGMRPPWQKPPGKPRKKKPGQKPGHPGVCRPKPEKIDHYKEHTLCDCPECGTKLGGSIASRQRYTEDIPPVEPEVTEHTVNGYWCPECRKIVYAKVADALPNATLGLRLVVFSAWLHYYVGTSVNNIVRILGVFAGFKVSPGGLTQAWKRLALTLEPWYDSIGGAIRNSAVLNADETGWRVNGKTHWLWCFASKILCFYVIDKSRGSPVVKMVFGEIFRGILICDFWGAYNKLAALGKQRCFYHLFTELANTDKRNESAEWAAFRKKLARLPKDAVRLSERKDRIPTEEYESKKSRLHTRLGFLTETESEDKDVRRLIKRLNRHRNELFTFLDHEGVSPYNNHGEQQMRKPAINRKISQQNRTDAGAKTQAILMTLFKSADLQKLNPHETVLEMAKKTIDPSTSVENRMMIDN